MNQNPNRTMQTPQCDRERLAPPIRTLAEAQQRVREIYAAEGGALMGWLSDECHSRSHTPGQLADELGVTCAYIHQLRSGLRRSSEISSDFARSCARYLGMPPIVVKLVAGVISVADFGHPAQDEPTVLSRALNVMKRDPAARSLLPADVDQLPLQARRALVHLYVESSHQDLLGVRRLPYLLQHLQRAALIDGENCVEAVT